MTVPGINSLPILSAKWTHELTKVLTTLSSSPKDDWHNIAHEVFARPSDAESAQLAAFVQFAVSMLPNSPFARCIARAARSRLVCIQGHDAESRNLVRSTVTGVARFFLAANVSDRLLRAALLNAGVELAVKLRQRDEAFAAFLLDCVRDWNSLGAVGNQYLDEQLERVLIEEVGSDHGFLETYDQVRTWVRQHPENICQLNRFVRLARSLLIAFMRDGRIVDALHVLADVLSAAGLTDIQKVLMAALCERHLRDAVFEGRSSSNDFQSAISAVAGLKSLSVLTSEEFSTLISIEEAYGATNRGERERSKLLLEQLPLCCKLPSVEHAMQLGWRLYQDIKSRALELTPPDMPPLSARTTKPSDSQSTLLLNIYIRLVDVEKPALLHSLILHRALQLLPPGKAVLYFFEQWGAESFRPEDYVEWESKEHRVRASLVERTIIALYQSCKAIFREAHVAHHGLHDVAPPVGSPALEAATTFVGTNVNRYPKQKYFPYYYAKLLLMTGQMERAKKELERHSLQWATRWWFWETLAETLPASEDRTKLACLCKARLVATGDDAPYIGSLRRRLKVMLEASGESYSEEVVRRYAIMAQDAMPEAIGTAKGVLLSVQRQGVAITVSILVEVNSRLRPAIGSISSESVAHLHRGAPILCTVGCHDDVVRVLEVKSRSGTTWDLVPWEEAVVRKRRTNARSCILRTKSAREFSVGFESWREARDWRPGFGLMVRVLWHEKPPLIVEARPLDGPPSFAKHAEGIVEQVDRKGGATISGKVYIPRHIAVPLGLQEGFQVRALALANGSVGREWIAVCAERI